MIHSSDETAGQSIAAGEGAKNAVPVTNQSSTLSPDPQGVISRYHQAENVVICEGGGVLAVVLLKAGTIEAQQPAGGADPEISVRGLGKRLHNLLRQALLRRPHSLGIGSWRRLSGASGSKLKDRNNDKGDKQGGSDGGAREGESSFVVAPVHRVQHGMLTTQSKSEPREPSAGSRTPRIYHTSRTA